MIRRMLLLGGLLLLSACFTRTDQSDESPLVEQENLPRSAGLYLEIPETEEDYVELNVRKQEASGAAVAAPF